MNPVPSGVARDADVRSAAVGRLVPRGV